MHVDAAGGQVGGNAEERLGQFLDAHVAEMLAQEVGDLLAAHHRDQGQREIRQRIGFDEGFAHARGQFLDAPFERDAGGDDRAHARCRPDDRRARALRERLQDADMGKAARAAARQHEAHGAAGDEARETADIALRAHAQMMMGFEQPALEREMLGQAAGCGRPAAAAAIRAGRPRASCTAGRSSGRSGKGWSARAIRKTRSAWRRQSWVQALSGASPR